MYDEGIDQSKVTNTAPTDRMTTEHSWISSNASKDVQIVSIGAVNGKTGEEYHKYMVPTCAISPGASEINKIKKSGDGLTLRGTEVKAGQPKEVLEDFMDWLDRQTMDFLVAHNNYGFDSIVLRNNLKRFGVNRQIRISKNKDSWAFMKKLKREFPELDFQYFRLQHCLKIFSDEENPTALHECFKITGSGGILLLNEAKQTNDERLLRLRPSMPMLDQTRIRIFFVVCSMVSL